MMCEEDSGAILSIGAYDTSVACLSFSPEEGFQKRFRISDHSGSVRAVAIHRQWLATGSTDETIRLYNLIDCSEIGRLVHHEGSITWLGFSGDHMYSASEDGTVAVWRTGSWDLTNTLTGHKGPVYCLAIHPSGKLALSVGRDRILRTWDLSSGIAVFRQKLKEVAQLVKWSNSAGYYALSYRTTIELYCAQSGDIVSTINAGHSITSFVFVPKEMMAVSSEQSSIQLFSTDSGGECIAELKGHSQRVKSLAVLSEKNVLFSASSDGSVRAWKLTEPLGESVCMSVCDTGSRLNCMALASYSCERHETRPTAEEVARVKRKRKHEETGQGCGSRARQVPKEVKQEPSGRSTEVAEPSGQSTEVNNTRNTSWDPNAISLQVAPLSVPGCRSTECGEKRRKDRVSSSRTFLRHHGCARRARRVSGFLPFLHKRHNSARRHKHLIRSKRQTSTT